MDSGQQITVGNRPNDFHSLPDNWQLCSLGEITTSSQYGISSSSGGNYSVPILKMNNLQDGHIDLRDLDYIQLSKTEMESLLLNKGDLLINRTNSADLVGKAAMYDLVGEHVFASYLVRFRLGPSVLPAFVNFFLNSEPGQSKLKLLATKGVSQANINPSILKRLFFVPVPPLPEQHAIATVLSDVDALITSLDRLIAKKRDIKQATMQPLLTGKKRLPGFSGELKPCYKQTEVGMIPEDWNLLSLGELATTVSSGKSKAKSAHGTYPVHGSTGVIGYAESPEYEGNALLVARVGANAGKLSFVTGRYGVTDNTIIVRLKAGSWLPFFWQQLETKRLNSLVFGSGQPLITGTQLKGLLLCVPPTDEQKAISTILSDMDAEIVSLEQKRDKARALKQGMMQELLTGKTRLL
jgi:type I restriction enzyme S subunit